jgi:hypothetical protein
LIVVLVVRVPAFFTWSCFTSETGKKKEQR